MLSHRWLLVTSIGALLVLFTAGAHSGVILKSFTETPTALSVEWGWDPETVDSNGKMGTHWWAYLKIDKEITGGQWTGKWLVHRQFQHLTAPHAGDVAPGPLFTGDGAFHDNDLGVVINKSGSWTHPQVGYFDHWRFVFDRSAAPENTSITLQVNHVVPEPTTLLLFGTGFSVVLGFARGRRRT